MNKSIIIKSGVILVVLGVVHSVFWFFKTGQIEKQINNLINENSTHISAGEVSVSGFPLKQTVSIKDLKFSFPNPAFSKYQVTVKNLQATSGIFSSNFTVSILEQASIIDNDTNVSGLVEFSKEPEISATVKNGMIEKFSYQDFGHRVIDSEKNVLYATSSTNVTLESALEEGDKIKTKVSANLKDIEGFDILSIYRNSSEKKVIEGIKTGEITIGNSGTIAPSDSTATTNTTATTSTSTTAATTPATPITTATQSTPAATTATATPTTTATTTSPATPVNPTAPATKPEDMAAALSNNLVKSNFVIDAEYVLTPVQGSETPAQNDPTQIQETPVQYSKMLKINNLEFSNPLYKITINGQVDTFQDDFFPSGSVTIKVEKIDNLINHITAGLNQIADQKKDTPATVQSADLNASNSTPANPTATAPAATANAAAPTTANAIASIPAVDDSYQIFLKRFSTGLASVTKEMSAKNQLSKDDLSVFDIRREKNLDFLINETPTREILGKF